MFGCAVSWFVCLHFLTEFNYVLLTTFMSSVFFVNNILWGCIKNKKNLFVIIPVTPPVLQHSPSQSTTGKEIVGQIYIYFYWLWIYWLPSWFNFTDMSLKQQIQKLTQRGEKSQVHTEPLQVKKPGKYQLYTLKQWTYLREVNELSRAGNYFCRFIEYPRVDDHDVGKLCCKPKLNLHPTIKLQATAPRQNYAEKHSNMGNFKRKIPPSKWTANIIITFWSFQLILFIRVPWATAHCKFRADWDAEQWEIFIWSVRERLSDRLLRSSRACLPLVISQWPMSGKKKITFNLQ